ncbi:MAG: hypothetical protein P1U81_13235 [Verrucomicrobiales bacterium]|nr:hypothetical protein [bacterium]MDF2377202.1 hypothetical protein [Verrucomicrobiales bacterium]
MIELRMPPRFLSLTLLSVCAIAFTVTQSQAQTTAQPDPALRPTLESVFNSWSQAIMSDNLEQWEASTAYSRQIEIRNRIVSQKLPFPDALFADPIGAPTLEGLIGLGVLSTGFTATSTYFGKANFGTTDGVAITDNLLVLHFLKEDGSWKFDTLRIVKIGADAELLLQIRNSDFSFLNGVEFQPAPQLPPIPQPVNTPEFIAEVWVDATGYEVTVEVNGHSSGTFSNLKTTELVMGGVRPGQNTVRLTTRLLENAEGASPKIEIAIYAARDPSAQADRVFHYRPGAEVKPELIQSFNVQ